MTIRKKTVYPYQCEVVITVDLEGIKVGIKWKPEILKEIRL